MIDEGIYLNRLLSVIIPAYREGKNLASNLEPIIHALRFSRISFEIILIVDMVSNDSTSEVAKRIASSYHEVHLIIRHGRQGVGSAIRLAIRSARGENVLILMADGAESVNDVTALASAIKEGYDIVVGSRFIENAKIIGYPPMKHCFNRLCNLVVRLLFRIPTSDITNAFKAYSLRIVRELHLRSSGYSIFLELPIKAYLSSSRKLAEIPISHTATSKRHGLRIFRDGIFYCVLLFDLILLSMQMTRRRYDSER